MKPAPAHPPQASLLPLARRAARQDHSRFAGPRGKGRMKKGSLRGNASDRMKKYPPPRMARRPDATIRLLHASQACPVLPPYGRPEGTGNDLHARVGSPLNPDGAAAHATWVAYDESIWPNRFVLRRDALFEMRALPARISMNPPAYSLSAHSTLSTITAQSFPLFW
jgi:hypothetical protein